MSGFGQGNFTSGDSYEGQYVNGKLSGLGTYIFKNGEKYVGQFENGNFNGFGTLYSANGEILKQGFFEDDVFVGDKNN
jgi:hypothetical protein